MVKSAKSADAILNTALEMADEVGWEALRMHHIAQQAGIGLYDIRKHYREKEELVEAWFDRADLALLRESETADFADQSCSVKLTRLITAWLNSLGQHQRVTRQMILGKLEPGHLHVQIPAILRISRTVQWLREAAGLEGKYLRRAIEETGLTGIYLMIFCRWLWDGSEDFRVTRRLMDNLLGSCDWVSQSPLFHASDLHAQQ